MSAARRVIAALLLCALLELPLWSTTGVSSKELTDTRTSLYRLDPTYGRALLPLHALTLQDAPFLGAYTIGGVSSNLVPQTLPTMLFSPHSSALVTVTTACAGCRLWHAKYTTIRVYDMATGMLRARFHPQRGPLTVLAVSDDGSRLSALQSDNVSHSVWIMLDGHTGHVLRVITLPDLCCQLPLLDPASNRLYVAGNNLNHQLTLAAFDLTSGTQLATLPLPAVWAGYWNTAGIGHYWLPGLAISPDGRRLAVLDGHSETLTMIDTPNMRVASVRSVSRPRSVFDRLADVLGLTPTSAEAKGLGEGASYTLRFSRDGRSLYLVGDRAAANGGQQTQTDLGLERIDPVTGELRATALAGLPVWWMDQATDGSALYAIAPASAYENGCPCNLQRLDPASLDVTATRIFPDVMPRLFVIPGG